MKVMFERDVEKKPLTEDEGGNGRQGNYNRSFQLCLMGIFTFLMWMVIFSIGGFFSPSAYLNLSTCNSPAAQVNQTIVSPTVQQTGIFLMAIMTEDKPNLSVATEQGGNDIVPNADVLPPPTEPDFQQDGSVIPIDVIMTDLNTVDALINALVESDPMGSSTDENVCKYYISGPDEELNWFEALQQCMACDSLLVAITTRKKHEEIQQLLVERGSPEGDFWTAGTNLWTDDRQEYFWASLGEPFTFEAWSENSTEPDKQNCVQITRSLDSSTKDDFNYRWNDNACHIKSRFICERI